MFIILLPVEPSRLGRVRLTLRIGHILPWLEEEKGKNPLNRPQVNCRVQNQGMVAQRVMFQIKVQRANSSLKLLTFHEKQQLVA